jgi:DNA-binding HxlR family transcriptional regulator
MSESISPVCNRFHQAVELIGGRWTGAIIQALLRGKTRYAALKAVVPDITDRMLSERLRFLETEGLVTRHVLPESPVKVEYELTDKGRSLERALTEIGNWANRWIPGTPGQVENHAAGSREPVSSATARTPPRGPRIRAR